MALTTQHALFIHIPKTGGSSVRRALWEAGLARGESGPFEVEDHYGIEDVRPELRRLFSFAFVREPLSWLRSRWAWALESDFPRKMLIEEAAAGHWMAECFQGERVSFRVFIERYLQHHPGVCGLTYFRMLGWRNEGQAWRPGENAVRFVGRQESLWADLRSALIEAAEDVARLRTEPHLKSTDHIATEPLPRSLEAGIYNAEAAVYQIFYAESLSMAVNL